MKKILLLCLALSGSLAHAQDIKPPPVPAPREEPKAFVADGQRVEVPGAGFSMVPPAGWEVQPVGDGTGTSLLFQAPKPKSSTKEYTYQANIRVMSFFDKPTAIDDIAKEEWSKTITENMSSISNRTDEFSLLSAEKVKLQSGADAILFYSSFKFDSVQMMQMHILVSNAKNTFLMTYTDLGKVFEAQDAALTTAYTSMHSATLDSTPAPRFQMLIQIGIGVGGFLILLVLIRFMRSRRVAKMGDGLDDEGDSKSDGTTDYNTTGISTVTEVDRSSRRRSRDDEYEDKPKKKSRRVEEEEEYEAAPVSAVSDVMEVQYSQHEEDVYEEPAPAPPPPAPAPKKAAPAPAPVAKKAVNAPAPAPQAKAQKVSSPKPSSMTAAPTSKSFENRKRKDGAVQTHIPTQTQMPMSQVSNAAVSQMPVSEVANWNIPEADRADDDVPLSEVMPSAPLSEVQEFAKKERTKSSMKGNRDDDDDMEVNGEESEVARLSEILPRDAEDEKPKKRGFFSWGKKDKDEEASAKKGNKKPSKKADDDDEAPVSNVSDAWAMDNKKSVGKKAADAQPVSEVAEWNMAEGSGDVGADDDDDENR